MKDIFVQDGLIIGLSFILGLRKPAIEQPGPEVLEKGCSVREFIDHTELFIEEISLKLYLDLVEFY